MCPTKFHQHRRQRSPHHVHVKSKIKGYRILLSLIFTERSFYGFPPQQPTSSQKYPNKIKISIFIHFYLSILARRSEKEKANATKNLNPKKEPVRQTMLSKSDNVAQHVKKKKITRKVYSFTVEKCSSLAVFFLLSLMLAIQVA
jgi:hypothetical protein